MRVSRSTTPEAIRDCLHVQFAETISYKVAQPYHIRLLGEDLMKQRDAFRRIPAYERALLEIFPTVYTDFQTTGKSL
jgi:hypothetical protein